MSRRSKRGLSGVVALALLAAAAAPAGAESVAPASGEFRFELGDLLEVEDEFLAIEEIDFGAEARELETAAEPVRIAALAVTSVGDPGRLARISANQATSAPKASKAQRTGRWLKKHWWVPTLVGVALGVVLLEPFDDDDAERRRAQMNP